ncbi:hypothetical protein ACLOJK_008177 [Asimina triloba]
MAVFVRSKRVTDPLDDRVKACICGRDHRTTGSASGSSSGSEHDAHHDSALLSDLIHGFLEDDAAAGAHHGADGDEGSDRDDPDVDQPQTAAKIEGLVNPAADRDPFRIALVLKVAAAVEAFSGTAQDRSALRRAVMGFLRDAGYNAGVCKTRWERSGGLAGGCYEFVDVVRGEGDSWQRYIVDVGFTGEFEIARPTAAYEKVLQALPRVYVGRPEELRQLVRLLSDAAKRSMRGRGLHLPPWRKSRYMQAKWLGPYKRTLNATAKVNASAECERFAVKCRSVGFNAVSERAAAVRDGNIGGRFLLCGN